VLTAVALRRIVDRDMNENPTEFVGRRKRSDETEAVIRALRRHDQAFADLFESIEFLLEEPLLPGWRRHVAHSGRELTAGLPDILVGSSIAAVSGESLVEEAREDPHPDAVDVDQDESPPVQENHKHRIAQMVSELANLPSEGVDESQYVDAFWEVHGWFQKRAHQRRDSKAETEDRADYVAVYQRFRRLLAGLLADYPTTRKALGPILDKANAQPWRLPTLAQVAEVIQLTPRLRESDFFFGRLENPLWLDTLTEIGAFDSPPRRVVRDGYLDLPRWPISEFLARVAAGHPSPEKIAALVLGLASTDNLRVQADLLRAAVGVAPPYTADLTPYIRRWIADTSQGAISIILDEIGVWMVHQAGDPEMRSLALRVLRSLIEPVLIDHETQGSQAYLRLPNWDLQRFVTLYLIPVAHVLPLKTTEVLAGALGRALTIERGPTGQKGRRQSMLKEDFSSIWLERVGAWREGARGADIALAQATFLVASAAIEGAPLDTKAIVAAREAPGWLPTVASRSAFFQQSSILITPTSSRLSVSPVRGYTVRSPRCLK